MTACRSREPGYSAGFFAQIALRREDSKVLVDHMSDDVVAATQNGNSTCGPKDRNEKDRHINLLCALSRHSNNDLADLPFRAVPRRSSSPPGHFSAPSRRPDAS
jgi:hypothetical protein